MPNQPIGVQRRFMELGRIRLGSKGEKVVEGETKTFPKKLSKFRLTSASRSLLEAAAQLYGGTVKTWENAPDDGYFELFTETDTLEIVIPPVFSDRDGEPTAPYSQFYELWKAGGCERRCDGATELLSGKPCKCDAENRDCKITTRLSVILHQVPGVGVWRMESHGWNAASLLPGTLDLLIMAASEQKFIPAVLRLEQRTSKKGGQTRKFVVPVIDLPQLRMAELPALIGTDPLAINPPQGKLPRPELPAAPRLPEDAAFENEPQHGPPPPIPVPEAAPPDSNFAFRENALFRLTDELGVTEARQSAKKARANKTDAEYGKWLDRQIKTAGKNLEAKRAGGEGDGVTNLEANR